MQCAVSAFLINQSLGLSGDTAVHYLNDPVFLACYFSRLFFVDYV
uniref:Uncharacterized protein n=1 Tax=Klebsiella pneumoniae TaxID=573 RepID=A0A2R4ND19_KLEPN|nr:Hypothetical protein [Klebsiella pneumoniae]